MSQRSRVGASARRAARRPSLLLAAATLLLPVASPGGAAERPASVARVVSLNPSLTAIVQALGAEERLVGIDDWSARSRPGLDGVPRVGGLYNPSLEAVVALEPDLVVLVPSVEQRDFRRRLEGLGIHVEVFANLSKQQVLENVTRLGELLDREAPAAERVAAIERTWRAVARTLEGRPPVRALVVVQRDPLFVVGGGGFLHEMLTVAGARNLGAAAGEGYPRVSDEWLVATAPDVLIDTSPEPGDGLDHYARYPSLPAVRSRRVLRLDAAMFSLPGPSIDRALLVLVEALQGSELRARVEQALAGREAPAAGTSP